MAVVRARSAPPYALIAFVALWVVSTVLAVLFYIKWSGTDKELQDTNRSIANIGSSSERREIANELINSSPEKGSNITALRSARSQIDSLRALLSGSPATPTATVVANAKEAMSKAGKGDVMIAAFNALAAERDSSVRDNKDLQNKFTALSGQINESNKSATERLTQAGKDVETLRQQLTKANDDLTKALTARDEAVTKSQDDLSKAQAKFEEDRRGLVLALEQAKSELTKVQQQVKELRIALANAKGGDTTAKVGEPDGRIVKVNAANAEVYINLVSSERIVPGLTFGVYDVRNGVRFGTQEEAEGKGSIEVIQPGTPASLCRITHISKGQSIHEGDLIWNPVYAGLKGKKMRFVIFGDFDLDGDGIATADERERLTRLVTSWGGVVDENVSTQTDYLVMGAKPNSPVITAADAATAGSTTDKRTNIQDEYDRLVVEAKSLSIPVLNSNRFLSMIGYYSTTIVRY